MRVCPQQEKGRVRLAEEELEASAPAPLVHFHLETRARMTHDGCFSLLLLALCSLSLRVGVQAFSLDVPVLKTLYEATCPYLGCAVGDDAEPDVSSATDDLFPAEMPLNLDGEETVRKYPAFPHSPLLVAAGACDAVVLRWRSFETPLWPVDRFVLQRYPDRENQPQWSTLLEDNVSELVDLDVQPGRRYAYRLQAVCRDNVSSAYEYHWTQVDGAQSGSTTSYRSSSALLGSVGTLNAEGLRSLGLIFACFLTVYGLMRASVMGVQGSQSRSYRLKRIKKSTSEVVVPAGSSSAPGVSMTPRRSSTSTSSSSPSIEVDPSQRSSAFDATPSSTTATAGGLTRAHSSTDTMLRQESAQTPIPGTFRPISRSIGAIDEKATACQYCGKRFGLFRKRYMCDICHSVSLCRKCGYQASVDSFASARTGMQMNSVGNSRQSGGRSMGRRRSSLSQQHQKKLKVRTICRNCCDDMYRYSTHASVRPSYVPAEM